MSKCRPEKAPYLMAALERCLKDYSALFVAKMDPAHKYESRKWAKYYKESRRVLMLELHNWCNESRRLDRLKQSELRRGPPKRVE